MKTLAEFMTTLPEGLLPHEVSRQCMHFLMHKQYKGRNIPDCASLRNLMA